jgi:hypothetical protein
MIQEAIAIEDDLPNTLRMGLFCYEFAHDLGTADIPA